MLHTKRKSLGTDACLIYAVEAAGISEGNDNFYLLSVRRQSFCDLSLNIEEKNTRARATFASYFIRGLLPPFLSAICSSGSLAGRHPSPSNNEGKFAGLMGNDSVWYFTGAKLFPNVKGCGYPPMLNCSIFYRQYANIGQNFSCYYSKVDPGIVISDLDMWQVSALLYTFHTASRVLIYKRAYNMHTQHIRIHPRTQHSHEFRLSYFIISVWISLQIRIARISVVLCFATASVTS